MDNTERVGQCPPDCVCDPCFRLYLRTLPQSWDMAAGTKAGRKEIEHGTIKSYQRGCHEECCKSVARQKKAEYRARKRQAAAA